mgnify:CR=1 FL=1
MPKTNVLVQNTKEMIAMEAAGEAEVLEFPVGHTDIRASALRTIATERAGLDTLLKRRQPGDEVKINAFRRDELMKFRVRLDPAPADQAKIAIAPRVSAPARALLKQWLGRG